MELELRDLRLVQAISEEGGVTKAAGRLNLTQPALSYQLRAAQQRVGTALFRRVGRRLVITASGERVLRLARLVSEEIARAESDISRSGMTHLLRLSTQCYTCYHWLPERAKLLHDAFSDVFVKIIPEATQRPLEALLDGQIDLAVVSSKVKHPRVRFRRLFEDEMVVVVAPGHRLATRKFVEPEDLRPESLLLYRPNENHVLNSVLRPAGVFPREVHEVPLTEAILEMVKADMGVGMLARWAVVPQVSSGSVCALRLTRAGFKRRWGAAWLRAKDTPPYVKAFVDLLAQRPLAAVEPAFGPRAAGRAPGR